MPILRKHLHHIIAVCLLMIISSLGTPASAMTEADNNSQQQMQNRLTGTWILQEAPEIRADGSRGQSYGEHPQGLLIINDDGRYSLQIYRSDRARYANGDAKTATTDELRAAALSHSTHYGRCFIDTARNILVFRIEHAANVNWDGTEQARQFELSGDVLSYRVPASANSSGTTTISVWKKIR